MLAVMEKWDSLGGARQAYSVDSTLPSTYPRLNTLQSPALKASAGFKSGRRRELGADFCCPHSIIKTCEALPSPCSKRLWTPIATQKSHLTVTVGTGLPRPVLYSS